MSSPRSPRRIVETLAPIVRRLMLLSAPACLLTLVAMEGALRLFGYVPYYLDGRAFVPSANTATLYELRAGFKGLYAAAPVSVNSRGFRGPEPAERPGLRVVMVGDSLTFGQGVRDEETLPARLHDRLREKLGPQVDIANLGVPGYNTCQEYSRFRDHGLALRPQVAILVFVENDTDIPPFQIRGQTVVSPDVRTGPWGDLAAAARMKSFLYNLAWTRWQLLKYRPIQVDQHREMLQAKFADTNSAWRRTSDCLRRLSTLARENRIRLLVVPFPVLAGLDETPYPFGGYVNAVCRATRDAGAECVDVVPALHGAGIALRVSSVDTHPSAAAYARVAARLAERLP